MVAFFVWLLKGWVGIFGFMTSKATQLGLTNEELVRKCGTSDKHVFANLNCASLSNWPLYDLVNGTFQTDDVTTQLVMWLELFEG